MKYIPPTITTVLLIWPVAVLAHPHDSAVSALSPSSVLIFIIGIAIGCVIGFVAGMSAGKKKVFDITQAKEVEEDR